MKHSRYQIYLNFDQETKKYRNFNLLQHFYEDSLDYEYEYPCNSEWVKLDASLEEILIWVDLTGIPLIDDEKWREVVNED